MSTPEEDAVSRPQSCYSDARPAVGMIRSVGPSHDMTIPACEEHWNELEAVGDRFDKPAAQVPGWLSCLVCGIEIAPYGSPDQACGGTVFDSPGHYGSTAFDPSDGTHLSLVVCDPCLVARFERVLHVTPESKAKPATWVPWQVGEESREWVSRQARHRTVPVGFPAVLPGGHSVTFDAKETRYQQDLNEDPACAVLVVDGRSSKIVHVGGEIAPGCTVTWVWTPPRLGSSLSDDPWYAAVAYEVAEAGA